MFDAVSESWKDEWVCIIGGGTSVKDINMDLLHGFLTLGVNNSALILNTDALFSLDYNWIKSSYPQYLNFSGEKYLAMQEGNMMKTIKDPQAQYLRRNTLDGLSTNKTAIHGHNSGYGALNLAVLKGAKRILLLGFDFYKRDGRAHWHEEYPRRPRARTVLYEGWARKFNTMVPVLNQLGIMVLNCSLHSKIECFPKIESHEIRNYFGCPGGGNDHYGSCPDGRRDFNSTN